MNGQLTYFSNIGVDMKKFICFLTFLVHVSVSYAGIYEKNFLPVSKIFTLEHGFDSNDFVEVAVFGFLPDSCHKLGAGKVEIDREENSIYLDVVGYVNDSGPCLNIITPYLEIIRIGTLDSGRYDIFYDRDTSPRGTLSISEADTAHQDQHLYAPVDSVDIFQMNEEKSGDLSQKIKIEGTYPYLYTGCMKIVEVRVTKTPNNILIIKPIAKIFEEQYCESNMRNSNRFEIIKDIDDPAVGQGLLHVRTLNGRAVNKLFDFSDL